MENTLKKNLNKFKFLIFTFPLFLISGPLIPEILIFLSIMFLKLYYSYFKKNNIYKNQINFCLILWFALIFCSFSSEYLMISFEKSLLFVRFFLFIFFLIFLFEYFQESLLKIYEYLKLILIGLIVDSFFQYIFGFNLIGLENKFRLSSFFGDEHILGSYLSKFYGLFLCLSFIKGNKDNLFLNKKNLYKHIIILVSVYTIIILTGERSAFVLINLIIVFFLFLKKKTRNFGYVIIFLIILVNFSIYNLNNSYKVRFGENFYKQTIIDISDRKFFPRDYSGYFNTSLEIFKSNIVSGSGIRTFRYECKKFEDIFNNSCNNHPHNYYFEILSETGLVGIFFFICFLIYFLKNLFLFKHEYFLSYLNLYILLLFQPFMTTGSFFNNWNLCLNSFIIAIVLYSNKKIHINNQTQ